LDFGFRATEGSEQCLYLKNDIQRRGEDGAGRIGRYRSFLSSPVHNANNWSCLTRFALFAVLMTAGRSWR